MSIDIANMENFRELSCKLGERDSRNPYSLTHWGLVGDSEIGSKSLAPKLWKQIFAETNLSVDYFVLGSNSKNDIVNFLERIKTNKENIGFNVARPWKGLVFSHCDYIETIAKKTKTVNTVLAINGKLYATNTDGIGILKRINEVLSLTGKKVLIIGSGGAAQTVPHYLSLEGIEQLYLTDKEYLKSEHLRDLYLSDFLVKGISIDVIHKEEIIDTCKNIDLIINATPCGMTGYPEYFPISEEVIQSINPNALVAEMVYTSEYTPLLIKCKNRRLKVLSGIYMLIEQAIFSFNIAFNVNLSEKEFKILFEECKKGVLK